MGAFDGLRGDQATSGFWGEHTSTIDWCENNYTHTRYIAEFVNTLSNLPSILIGFYGAYAVLQNKLPKRFAICYLGLSMIGLGSFGFHASLKWEWQLMDELPMIYVVSYAAYLVLDTRPGWEPRFGVWGPLVMLAWDVFVTVSYICLPNPVYHQVAFASILITSTLRTLVLILKRLPEGHPARAIIGKLMGWGVGIFAAGFAIWNIDNIFCEQFRDIRAAIEPFDFLVQGHSYWHYMTGYGAYLIFTASIYLHCLIKDDPDAYCITGYWLPMIKRKATMTPKHGEKMTLAPTEKLD
ncbi:dihydroceramidase [Cryptococcus wingfieldii CBS 7118]|uniref:Dihydroceramidase n=1 Tax=Cryptococcus wingfieldii CBS 7118 TaxID=1295528 RepID=A0A1E3J4S0_9TREE|nr:dihydroceramidase [Cryptococcus wingfieldii CBS 7118]ODN95880.1 dihydroceramidase [Cryptococcus wingfieldii CBS 7118]